MPPPEDIEGAPSDVLVWFVASKVREWVRLSFYAVFSFMDRYLSNHAVAALRWNLLAETCVCARGTHQIIVCTQC